MLAAILVLTGGVLMLIGIVLFVVNAFKVSPAWGLGVLLMTIPVGFVFVVKNWKDSKVSVFLQLGGLALLITGIVLGPPLPIR